MSWNVCVVGRPVALAKVAATAFDKIGEKNHLTPAEIAVKDAVANVVVQALQGFAPDTVVKVDCCGGLNTIGEVTQQRVAILIEATYGFVE
jgi:hypothetical protein